MDAAVTTSQNSPAGWSRGRLVGILAAAGGVAAVLLCALAYGIYLAISGVHTVTTTKASSPGTGESSLPEAGPQRRDAIAAALMLEVSPTAARPTEQTSSDGSTIKVPAGTAVPGPALVMTGYPRTPQGAIGQLAQIDAAVLHAMSVAAAREVHAAWALPGGAPVDSWWITTSVRAFLDGAGMGQVKDSAVWVRVEPAAALVKGVDGPDWTTVCVLMKVTATYRSEGQTALGHCERMQWVGGRWMIAPGAPPAPAPSTWPQTPLAVEAGWATWVTTEPEAAGQ
ncbi:hypothetical protein [Nocardioides sp.]|uniref:hypothetical protein n=1 Tax=Nocardioides sp. TaxID=35761 RepID=UPI002615625E|nr:hypothetical protein [Nocardioides sp.]MCW2737796.1 hypothetical protein [Nocardioides sp.]